MKQLTRSRARTRARRTDRRRNRTTDPAVAAELTVIAERRSAQR